MLHLFLVKTGVNHYREEGQRLWLQGGAASHSPAYTLHAIVGGARVGEDFSLSHVSAPGLLGGGGAAVCMAVCLCACPLARCVQLCTCESVPAPGKVESP